MFGALKSKIVGVKSKLVAPVVGALVAVGTAVPAFAEGETSTVAATMGTALTTVQADFMSTVTTVAPIALTIFGVFMVWKLGLRFFKSITGR